jgi:hypothetical protein
LADERRIILKRDALFFEAAKINKVNRQKSHRIIPIGNFDGERDASKEQWIAARRNAVCKGVSREARTLNSEVSILASEIGRTSRCREAYMAGRRLFENTALANVPGSVPACRSGV